MIFHITTRHRWNELSSSEYFFPEMFLQEKFIHCCEGPQIEGVLSRYFDGKKDLLKLCIDEKKLKFTLKYEPGTNNEMFPHVYGELNKDAIVKVEVVN